VTVIDGSKGIFTCLGLAIDDDEDDDVEVAGGEDDDEDVVDEDDDDDEADVESLKYLEVTLAERGCMMMFSSSSGSEFEATFIFFLTVGRIGDN